jgi:hypothetical protein
MHTARVFIVLVEQNIFSKPEYFIPIPLSFPISPPGGLLAKINKYPWEMAVPAETSGAGHCGRVRELGGVVFRHCYVKILEPGALNAVKDVL